MGSSKGVVYAGNSHRTYQDYKIVELQIAIADHRSTLLEELKAALDQPCAETRTADERFISIGLGDNNLGIIDIKAGTKEISVRLDNGYVFTNVMPLNIANDFPQLHKKGGTLQCWEITASRDTELMTITSILSREGIINSTQQEELETLARNMRPCAAP